MEAPDTMDRRERNLDDLAGRSVPVLDVRDLSVAYPVQGRLVDVVRSANVAVRKGEIVGLVGESGSGKSVTASACLGLTRSLGGTVTNGQILYGDLETTGFSERQWRSVRGRRAAMVFQQPTRSLNPAYTVGHQLVEAARRRLDLSAKEARRRATDLLDLVHVPRASERLDDYPHQFSGGMCQRVAIALALIGEPQILIADEPTTALDVTVQRRVLDLLLELRDSMGISVLLITHDLGVVAETCDRVVVMYAGETVEESPVVDLFVNPRHPYTAGLLRSIPHPDRPNAVLQAIPGVVPPPLGMPEGCRFGPRCDFVVDACRETRPSLVTVEGGRVARCRRVDDLSLPGIDS